MTTLPSKEAILQWIADHPTETAKRDIAKAFGIKGAARIDLKRILKELEEEGHLQKRSRSTREYDKVPPVALLQVSGMDTDGDLMARAVEWSGRGKQPVILIVQKADEQALGMGERFLGKVTAVRGDGYDYEARVIRRIGVNPQRILGVYRQDSAGGRIMPVDKGDVRQWIVGPGYENGAKDGELVEAEQAGPKGRMGLPKARIVARLGDPSGPRAISLIAIHQHNIPDHFPDAVIAEADAAQPAPLGKREDLRDLPLVTIDPEDARDKDDAVYAEADTDPKNKGGFVLWVAIADVAHYVTPGSELDREARRRGNSTYFPDRVVPMLPDVLSGDLCSLHDNVDRACLAVRMRINADGALIDHRFMRGLMNSKGSLEYGKVQAAVEGHPAPGYEDLVEPVLKPLYAAYEALKRARAARQPLELDLPERRIVLDDDGKVLSVAFKDRLDAHKLIEEFMVLANVAAAEALNAKKMPLLFRVHEEPNPDKIDSLREIAGQAGLSLAKGQVMQTAHLNRLLAQAAGRDEAELINMATLRSLTQAYYSPQNFGHFGLALRNYAHFTSPIRRYADLIVHRALIASHGWGKDGLTPAEIELLDDTGKVISDTERRSMQAERDTTDRYLAAYLADRVGAEFGGRVAGVQKFGLFVKMDDTGADAMVPVRSLGNEFFQYDPDAQTLSGEKSRIEIRLGARVTIKLSEVTPATGGLTAELVTLEDRPMPKGRGGPRSFKSVPRRKEVKEKAKHKKIERKVSRTRK